MYLVFCCGISMMYQLKFDLCDSQTHCSVISSTTSSACLFSGCCRILEFENGLAEAHIGESLERRGCLAVATARICVRRAAWRRQRENMFGIIVV
jgi:hypothetical protein